MSEPKETSEFERYWRNARIDCESEQPRDVALEAWLAAIAAAEKVCSDVMVKRGATLDESFGAIDCLEAIAALREEKP